VYYKTGPRCRIAVNNRGPTKKPQRQRDRRAIRVRDRDCKLFRRSGRGPKCDIIISHCFSFLFDGRYCANINPRSMSLYTERNLSSGSGTEEQKKNHGKKNVDKKDEIKMREEKR
jgi:hypothetical protein